MPTREQVLRLAEYFKIKQNDLLIAWLPDKFVYELKDEKVALKELQLEEEKVKYNKTNAYDKKQKLLFYSFSKA